MGAHRAGGDLFFIVCRSCVLGVRQVPKGEEGVPVVIAGCSNR